VLTCVLNSQTCNACPSDRPENDNLIEGARCLCIQCSKGGIWYTMDLCLSCTRKTIDRDSDAPRHHTIDHNLLQFRTVYHRRTLYEKQQKALDYLYSSKSPAGDDSEKAPIPTCHLCHQGVERPAWRCIDCAGESMLFNHVARR
jgi:hypothetical protein